MHYAENQLCHEQNKKNPNQETFVCKASNKLDNAYRRYIPEGENRELILNLIFNWNNCEQ